MSTRLIFGSLVTVTVALRTALKTLAKGLQEGNRDQIRKVIYAANPTEQKMVDAMSNMAAEIAGLNKAAANESPV